MAQQRRGGRREPKGVPWNERVVIDYFDRDAQVMLAFPDGPSVTAFLPSIPRAGELLTATRWGRKWRTEGDSGYARSSGGTRGGCPGASWFTLNRRRSGARSRLRRTLRLASCACRNLHPAETR